MATTILGKIKERIRENLSILTVRVKMETAVGHTDINREAEDFYCGLLNAAFGWNLSNLNALQMNFPAIDLADKDRRLAVQVTSTDDRKKVQDTLDRFFEKKLDKVYDRLIVLIIGVKPGYRGTFALNGQLDFDKNRDIWDIAALSQKIDALHESRIKAVDDYLAKQLLEKDNQPEVTNVGTALIAELSGVRKAVENIAANSDKRQTSAQAACVNGTTDAAKKENSGSDPALRKKRITETPKTVETIVEPIIRAYACRCEGVISEDHFDSLTLEALRKMVEAYGIHDYFFNLAIDIFVERTAELIEESLTRILKREIPEKYNMYFQHKDYDSLFCGYYGLSLIYKKTNNLAKLQELLAESYKVFRRYPLYYEVCSRILKRLDKSKDLRDALKADATAINLLEKKKIENCAVNNSYASTVCRMLVRKMRVASEEIENAMNYIEAAINFNPEYPKYYFVKAQLLYYSNLQSKADLPRFKLICAEVKRLVSNAESVLHSLYQGEAAHYDEELQYYGALRDAVDKELIKREKAAAPKKYIHISEEEAAKRKNKILESSGYESCVAPHKPVLTAEDEYIHVCYSPSDYKTVYCDLIELYRKKIPFQFDEMLSEGGETNERLAAHIRNPKCVGVIFYISKHSLISSVFCDQIKMVYGKKRYFAVNLEGNCPPTKIVMDAVLETCRKGDENHPIEGAHLRSFVLAFDDDHKYTAKYRVYGEKGTQHIPYLKKAVIKEFGLVV